MESRAVYFDSEPITVRKLINALETIEDKDLPVALSAPNGYTDYFWIEIKDEKVDIGTT